MSPRRAAVFALVLLLPLLAVSTGKVAAGAAPGVVQPRVASSVVTYAIVKTIPVVANPWAIAINRADDSVYVTHAPGNRVSVIRGSDDSVTTTRQVGVDPQGVAVNQIDDSVYVTNSGSNSVSVLRGADDSVVRTVSVGTFPLGVAVNDSDDTVYVVNRTNSTATVLRGSDDSVVQTITGLFFPRVVAVDQVDDTVYLDSGVDSILVLRGSNNSQAANVSLGTAPWGLAVDDLDDTVYTANRNTGTAAVVKGSNNSLVGSVRVGTSPEGIAVDQADDTVYVANGASGNVSVINGRTGLRTDDTITVGGLPLGIAVDGSGMVYVANNSASSVSVIASVSTSIAPAVALQNTPVSLTVNVPQVSGSYDIDDSTVEKIFFNGVEVPITGHPSDRVWSAAAPAGSGTVPVTVRLKGGLTASAGTFTYVAAPTITSVSPASGTTVGGTSVTISGTDLANASSVTFGGATAAITGNTSTSVTVTTPPGSAGPVGVAVTTIGGTTTSAGAFTYVAPTPTPTPVPPQPDPSRPPGAPGAVLAQAGDAQARVTWSRPSFEGSSPVTSYEVEAFPSGETCTALAPSTSCTVTGLENGSSYVFRVRARNSVGWSEFSSASNMVIPKGSASIVITGSRSSSDDRQVRVKGTTTGLVGKEVTPYVRFPGQTAFKAGTGTQKVAPDGTFTWQRKTGKKTYVYFQHADVRSNTVTIPAR